MQGYEWHGWWWHGTAQAAARHGTGLARVGTAESREGHQRQASGSSRGRPTGMDDGEERPGCRQVFVSAEKGGGSRWTEVMAVQEEAVLMRLDTGGVDRAVRACRHRGRHGEAFAGTGGHIRRSIGQLWGTRRAAVEGGGGAWKLAMRVFTGERIEARSRQTRRRRHRGRERSYGVGRRCRRRRKDEARQGVLEGVTVGRRRGRSLWWERAAEKESPEKMAEGDGDGGKASPAVVSGWSTKETLSPFLMVVDEEEVPGAAACRRRRRRAEAWVVSVGIVGRRRAECGGMKEVG